MTRNVRALVATVALGGGLFAAQAAHADTLSFAATIPIQSVAYTQTLQLTKFDTTLGTLTGVNLQLDTEILATVNVGNFSSPDRSFTFASASIPVSVTGPDSSVVTTTATASVSFNPPKVVPTGTIFTQDGLVSTASNSITIPLSSFAQYQGAGTQALTLNAAAGNAVASGTGDPNLFYAASGKAGGTVRITYTYTKTAVPEPGVLGLMATGIAPVAVGIIRRRRK